MAKSRKGWTIGITAFLDILGFGDRIVGAQSTTDIDAVVVDLRRLQEYFDFNSKHKHVKENQAASKKTVLAFSDSIVVNVALKSTMTELQGTFDLIMSELSGFALAQGRCVNDGLFLRGGVDLGWWFRSGDVLASESLTNAYRMEGSAVVPVIGLTDRLYDFLSKHPDRGFYSSDIEPVDKLFRQYSGEGPRGKISFRYLDYLTVVAESIDWVTSAQQRQDILTAPRERRDDMREAGYKSNLRNWFKHHAKQISLAHRHAASESVKRNMSGLLLIITR